MNAVNQTLFVPLYGKSKVSKQGIILSDKMAEKIWESEAFPLRGKSKSKWLTYNMAMRARVFDDWTEHMLLQEKNAVVLHIGCGLDSRCLRIKTAYTNWIDCDFPKVISMRKKYFSETEYCHMMPLDASDPAQIHALPDADVAIVVMEGISMYLTNEQLNGFLSALQKKYAKLHILMDVYTEFGAKASKYKNPVNDLGVTVLYGVGDIESLLQNTNIKCVAEHSMTPERLVNELKPFEQVFFKLMFSEKIYRKIYRLYELVCNETDSL